MIIDWQYEPLKGKLLHVDMKRIAMDKVLRVGVPVICREPPRREGRGRHPGAAHPRSRDRVLAGGHPEAIYADVSEPEHGDNLRVSDLAHGDKWKFITEEDQMVAHVTHVKEEVVATPEAVAAEAGTTPAEPEVIKKGKQETEGAAEGGEAPKGGEKKEKK